MTFPKILDGLHILLIEDDSSNRDVTGYALTLHGARTQNVSSAAVALDTLGKETRPDLILTDLSMSGTDGWSLQKMLRTRPDTCDLPIIAITAHAMRGDKERVLDAGFDGYISKPVNVISLGESVLNWLPLHQQRIVLHDPASRAHSVELGKCLRRKGAALGSNFADNGLLDALICYAKPPVLPNAGHVAVFCLREIDFEQQNLFHFDAETTPEQVAMQITTTLKTRPKNMGTVVTV